MTQRDSTGVGEDGITLAALDAPPYALLDEPLNYIFAEHFRQRSLCSLLRRYAGERRISREAADRILAFLDRDLPIHYQDEDDDLFPALRRRAHADDNLGSILARLSGDHRQVEPYLKTIIETLAADPARSEIPISRPTAEVMIAYAASEYRHLSLENGIVLVIARKRLTSADIKAIARAMKARRGVHL